MLLEVKNFTSLKSIEGLIVRVKEGLIACLFLKRKPNHSFDFSDFE